MRKIIVFLFTLFIINQVKSQNLVKGKINDSYTNLAIATASISINGKTVTSSNEKGEFSFTCNGNVKILISHVSYVSKTIVIKNCTDFLGISLEPYSSNLQEIEVTATSNENKNLLHQPASISKIGSGELKRGQGLFLDDAINANIPGMSMQRRTISAGQQFNIRGYGNGTRGTRGISSNFDGQGYKMYLNGIPVTDAEGITLMDDIDFGSIANVEVTKGPAGTLYGLAISGAVNLKTIKANKGETSVSQNLIVGQYGLLRSTTQFAHGTEKSSILLNFSSQHVDGYMPHTASDKKFVNFIGEFQPTEKQSISTYFGYTNSYDERAGELTISQYENKDYSIGNIEYVKRNAHSNVASFRAGVNHQYTFSKAISNSTSVFGTGLNSNVSSAGGWTDKAPFNVGLRTVFNTKFALNKVITLTGITGYEIQYQRANTMGYSMKQNPLDTTTNGWSVGKPYWVINALTSNVYTEAKTSSAFTEWTLNLPKDFSVTAGISISDMKIFLSDRFNTATATKPSDFDTSYKAMVSPHVAINKVINKHASVYASYSTGYKAPASSYFYITTPVVTTPATPATGRINSGLKPEFGSQIELGTKGSFLNGKLNYQLAYFHSVYSNKMTNVAVQLNSTTTAYSYVVNGGKQENNGIELLAKYNVIKKSSKILSSLTPFVNLAYSDFKYKDFVYKTGSTTTAITTYDYSGLNAFGIPKIASTIGVDFSFVNGFYGNVYQLYKDGFNIGYETISGTNYLRKTTSYSLLNAKIGYKTMIGKHFTADANIGMENITKTQYPLMVFVNQLPDAYMPAPLNGNIFGGFSINYIF